MKLIVAIFVAFASACYAARFSDKEYESIFADWMKEYDKTYSSEKERVVRFSIFKKNYEAITAHNEEPNQTFTMEVNRFADISKDDYDSVFGALPSADDRLKLLSNPPDNFTEVINEDYKMRPQATYTKDWRTSGIVPPVRNSPMLCPAAYNYAPLDAVEMVHALNTSTLIAGSPQHLLDCIHPTCYCEFGYHHDVFLYAKDYGVTLNSDYPPHPTHTKQACGVLGLPRPLRIRGSTPTSPGSTSSMLQALDISPVVSYVRASIEIQFYKQGIMNLTCQTNVNHFIPVTVVGYHIGETDDDSYYIVRFMWGWKWGESGYMRLGMYSYTCGLTIYAERPFL